MIEDFNWLIVLIILGLLIFYSNNNISNTIEDYRVEKNVINYSPNLESYKDRKRIRDAKVYVGECPFKRSDILQYNTDDIFGEHSVYEVGRLSPIITPNKYYHNYYGTDYANYYSVYV